MQRVVLHLGMAKTGTTALQVALARNREWLSAAGVHYPERGRPGPRRLTQGNGSLLHDLLLGDGDPNGVELVRRAVKEADGRDVLFSSEHLFLVRPERFADLAAVTEEAGARLDAVVYLRDLAGHAISTYSQAVKRHGFAGTFADFVTATPPRYSPRLPERLSRLLEVFGPDRLTVGHYDSDKDQLLERFLTTLGVEDHTGLQRTGGTANRSLTSREIAWMRMVNSEFPARREVTNRISSALMALPPIGESRPSLHPRDVALLAERYGGQVDWVNQRFLDGRLRVDGGVEVDESEDASVLSPAEEHLLAALVDVARRAEGRSRRH